MSDKAETIKEMKQIMCEESDTDICKYECPISMDCANNAIAERLYDAGYRKQSETAEEIRNNLEAQGRYEFCALDGKEYLTIQTDKLNCIIKHYTAPLMTGGKT